MSEISVLAPALVAKTKTVIVLLVGLPLQKQLGIKVLSFFFHGASCPQKTYGLLGTGEEWDRE